jgi:hypothetical protein
MFKVDTTIVLGAGSSHSYGYPLGDKLIDDLVKLSKPKIETDGYGIPVEITPSKSLYEGLLFYDPMSIDSFLMHYKEDEELIQVAKNLISQILLNSPKEVLFQRGANLNAAGISENNDPTNWYRFLWDAIVGGLSADELTDEATDLRFNIITFNYDNSLENFWGH